MGWKDAPLADDSAQSWKDAPIQGGGNAPTNTVSPSGVEPSFTARVGRGLLDTAQGLKQFGLQALEAGSAITDTSGRSIGVGNQTPQDALARNTPANRYSQQVGQEIAQYEADAGDGIDYGRLTGNLVSSAPTALLPGVSAAGLLPRTLASAAGGGLAGGAMFVPEGGSRLNNTLSGLALGAVAPAAFEPIRKGISNVISRFAGSPGAAQDVERTLAIELQQQGVDYNSLGQAVKESLIRDVQATINAGNPTDPQQLGRQADILAVGAQPTRASITRSPQDWQIEMNTRGIAGVGEPIVERQQSNAQKLVDFLQNVRKGTGSPQNVNSYSAGQRAIGAVNDSFKRSGDEVSQLYTAARNEFGGNASIPLDPIQGRLMETLNNFEDVIPSPISNRLKDFGIDRLGSTKSSRALTVDEAEKTIKLINSRFDPSNRPQAAALGQIRDALKDGLSNISAESQAVDAYNLARSEAAKRFEKFAPKNLKGITEGNITPDRFIENRVLGGKIEDLKSLKTVMTEQDKGSWDDVKSVVIDDLLKKATGATDAVDANGRAFSGVKFGKALDSIEPQRLNTIFTPEEINALQTLKRASKNLTEQVPFSSVNHSNTASALANILGKVGNTPILNGLVSPILGVVKLGKDWTKDANARKEVAEMLLGSSANTQRTTQQRGYGLNRFAPATQIPLNQPSQGSD